jgi:NAD(P)-dependent dehydrogenase (short-subunit alcohol dehydrogenase family)
MTDRTNKVAIVTGASRGIGAAVAERLAGDGFTVVINYSGDTRSAEVLARKIEGKGGRALVAEADVSDPNAVRGMFDTAEETFGGVDVLVNNAGIMKLAKIADSDDALSTSRSRSISRAASTRCAKPQSGCATADGSSISPPAWSGSSSRPTVSMPPPNRRWKP